jgi:hypothetical protein
MKIPRRHNPDRLASCTGSLMILGGIVFVILALGTVIWLGWKWISNPH